MIDFLTAIWPGLQTLLAVVVGGLITYFTTRALDAQRWEKQQREKLLHDRRDALDQISAWIAPIQHAVEEAISISDPMRSMENDLPDDPEHVQQWPDLIHEIAARDIQPPMRYLLPEGLYFSVRPIVVKIRELSILSARYESHLRFMKGRVRSDVGPSDEELKKESQRLGSELWERGRELNALAQAFAEQLEREYLATYSS